MPWVGQPFESYWTEDENGCHIWHGGKNDRGYGYFAIKQKMFRAHRIAYERANGPIPDGLTIDHLCFVKLCVNAVHLEAVTASVNTKRHFSPKGLCRRGHDEWLTRGDGRGRECRACKRMRFQLRRDG